jgi:hypothetical protein
MEWERSNCTQSPKNKIIKAKVAKYNHRRQLLRKNCRCSRQILNWLIGDRDDLAENAHTEVGYWLLSGRCWLTSLIIRFQTIHWARPAE